MDGRTEDPVTSSRLQAVDALRGLIIVLMALDHANHFVAQKHSPGEYWGGAFPAYAAATPFLTRLVTHLAAPGFFFLMGAGMTLYVAKYTRSGQSRLHIMRHFWIRGALLIALQFLVVNRAWQLSPGGWGPSIYVGVLYALGGVMIVSSLLLWLRPGYLLLLASLLFIGTELMHPNPADWNQMALSEVQRLLIHPGGDLRLWSNYPILPWLELAVFGLAFGKQLAIDPRRTYRQGLWLGVGLLALFALVRLLDGFGNIRPMAGTTWIDFFNVVKYPPSWSFTLLTMGINLIVLWFFARLTAKRTIILWPLVVYGRAPLFFYLVHLFLYAGLGLLLAPEGTSIAGMIPYWLLGLIILYPLCLIFTRLKRNPKTGWALRYL